MRIKEVFHTTHPGTVRTHNEDAYLAHEELALYGIADGMGDGSGNGRQAAQTALDKLQTHLQALQQLKGSISQERSTTNRLALSKQFDALFNEASHEIRTTTEEQGYSKYTTTLLLAMLIRNFAYIAHVGNSVAFVLRGGQLIRLNEDHSLARYRYRRGRLTHEEFLHSPARHILYQSLGAGMEVDVDLAEVRLFPHDTLLLCSDGLLRSLDEQTICELIEPHELRRSGQQLLERAQLRGAPDNMSFVLLSFESDEDDEPIEAITGVMEQVFLFQHMSPAERLVIAPYLEEAVFDKGDTILNTGDLGDCFYVMVSGHARITREQAFLSEVGPGDHFGELALARPVKRSATVQALTECHLFYLSHRRFQDLLRYKPEIGARMALLLLDTMGERLRDMTERLSAIERAVRG